MRNALNPFIFAEEKSNAGPFIFKLRKMFSKGADFLMGTRGVSEIGGESTFFPEILRGGDFFSKFWRGCENLSKKIEER